MAASQSIERVLEAHRQFDARVRPALVELTHAVGRLRMPRHDRALARELQTIRDELVAAHQAFVEMLDGQASATQVLASAILELQQQVARLEHDNVALRAAEVAWRREYEPDTDPDRPSFFSNLRHAVAALKFR